MQRLMAFYWDCGRMGELRGRFVLDDDGYALLQSTIGKRIYFGEVLGKHSEIEGSLDAEDVTLVTDNQEFLEMAGKLGIDLDSGFNPLDYLADEEPTP